MKKQCKFYDTVMCIGAVIGTLMLFAIIDIYLLSYASMCVRKIFTSIGFSDNWAERIVTAVTIIAFIYTVRVFIRMLVKGARENIRAKARNRRKRYVRQLCSKGIEIPKAVEIANAVDFEGMLWKGEIQ